MASVGQLTAVTPAMVAEAEAMFVGLFDGPLPGSQVVAGEGVFPLVPGREELIAKANEMVETFNSNTWRYGVVVLLMIKGSVERVLDELPKLLERLDYALDHYAPVLALIRASGSWTEVMTGLSEVAGSIDRDVDNTDLRDWQDDARDIYSQDIVPHQHNAVLAAKDNAAYISNLLSEIATANIEYATELVKVVANVYAEIVKIVLELASLVGSPFAIQDAAGLVATIINSVADVVAGVVNDFAQAVDRIRNAENELADHTYFPGGLWPEAVERA